MELFTIFMSFTASVLNFVKGWMLSSKPVPDHTVSNTFGGTSGVTINVQGENPHVSVINITVVQTNTDTS